MESCLGQSVLVVTRSGHFGLQSSITSPSRTLGNTADLVVPEAHGKDLHRHIARS